MRKFILSVFFMTGIAITGICLGSSYLLANILSRVVGAPVSVGRVHIGLLSSEVGIYDVKVKNPEGFQESYLAFIPEIYLQADLAALFKKQLRIKIARFKISEVTVEKNDKGIVNLRQLSIFKTLQAKEKTGMEVHVDLVQFAIKNVRYVESFINQPPLIRQYPVNIQEDNVRDVTNPKRVTMDVVSIILERVGLGGMVSQPGDFTGALSQESVALNRVKRHFPF